jgi:hypothetical protein
MALANFAWGSTRPLKPLRKIRDFDLMFDSNVGHRNLHYAELFLDAFHPFVFAECCEPQGRARGGQTLRYGFIQCVRCDFRCMRNTVK